MNSVVDGMDAWVFVNSLGDTVQSALISWQRRLRLTLLEKEGAVFECFRHQTGIAVEAQGLRYHAVTSKVVQVTELVQMVVV